MDQPVSAGLRNSLLNVLAPDDLDRLRPHLDRVPLEHKQTLAERNEPITHAYFIEAGITSTLVHVGHGEYIEAGLMGREGMVGPPLVHNVERSAHRVIVQVPGEAWRIQAGDLAPAMRRSEPLRSVRCAIPRRSWSRPPRRAGATARTSSRNVSRAGC